VRRLIPLFFFFPRTSNSDNKIQSEMERCDHVEIYPVVGGGLLAGSSIGNVWLRPAESGVDAIQHSLYQFIPVALPTPFLSFLSFRSLICPLCLFTLGNLVLFALLRVYALFCFGISYTLFVLNLYSLFNRILIHFFFFYFGVFQYSNFHPLSFYLPKFLPTLQPP
jgi:hypothetical protein